jgi:hypothetical protein
MLLLVALAGATMQEPVTPLARAHAHNDYRHARPLLDALDAGFTSIEADVFLVNGELLVGHDKGELKPERSLRRLYLDPLLERVRRNKGSVYARRGEVLLLVDIKENGAGVYEELKKQLKDYTEMLTSFDVAKGIDPKAVMVVLSGDRPIDLVRKEEQRQVFLDGRLTDLAPNLTDAQFYPLISASWTENFKWNGKGQMPLNEAAKLRLYADRAHAQRQKIRFWGAPDTPDAWDTLYGNGVDLLNTDDLIGLSQFLRKRK